MDEVG